MRTIGIMAALLLTGASAQGAFLDWLAGTWCTAKVDGRQTCETWVPMGSDRVMRGIGETRGANGARQDVMTISEQGGRLVFHAEPDGQAPADFVATTPGSAPASLEFVNREHDYPQRIRYWREGKALVAEIALADGSKPQRWRYRRVK